VVIVCRKCDSYASVIGGELSFGMAAEHPLGQFKASYYACVIVPAHPYFREATFVDSNQREILLAIAELEVGFVDRIGNKAAG
jgi:hypothetical protein